MSSFKAKHGPKEERQAKRRENPHALSGASDTDHNDDLYAAELLILRISSIVSILFFGQRLSRNKQPAYRFQDLLAPLLLHSTHAKQKPQVIFR